ncbi:hypothetical protein C8Q74DRAFT_1369620 [Fomes fomentarius]|nr:hypothetical protein C8Q74DRAFT_1369620 [Fomes fomentarius]
MMGLLRLHQTRAVGATDRRIPTSTSQPRLESVQGSSRSAAPAPDAMDTDEQLSMASPITDLPVPPPASDLPLIDALDHFLDGDDNDEDEDEINPEEVRCHES